MVKKIGTRDVANKTLLNQLDTSASFTGSALDKQANTSNLDTLLDSLNSEVKPVFRILPTIPTADLVITLESAKISNPKTLKNRLSDLIWGKESTFTGSTITLPAVANGASNIVNSGGSNIANYSQTASTFAKLAIFIGSDGEVLIYAGTPAASEALAQFPAEQAASNGALAVGYVVIETDASQNIQSVTMAKIYQFYNGSVNGLAFEPNGFPNRTASTPSFVDGTRTYTLTPVGTKFKYYSKGVEYTKTTAQSVVISNTKGIHYIYFNGDTLTSTTTFSSDIITTYAYVGLVHWSVTDARHTRLGEERHGIIMPGAVHSYLHTTRGTQYLSGLGLSNFVIGNGDLNTHAQFSVAAGSIADEDIVFSISAISVGSTSIPIFWKSGAAGDWRTVSATPTAFAVSTFDTTSATRLAWNQFTGGAWQKTQVASGNYVLAHIFATTDLEYPMISFMGQAEYTTLGNAQTGATTEMNNLVLAGLPSAEWKPIASIIYQTSLTYANTVNARVVLTATGENYVNWATSTISPSSTPASHSSLLNLDVDSHLQYAKLSGRSGDILAIDTINEFTSNAGVTIDGLLIKDGGLNLVDSGTAIVASANPTTRKILFNVGNTATSNLTLQSNQSTTQTLNIPNITATDTLVTNDSVSAFTGKTISDKLSFTELGASPAAPGAGTGFLYALSGQLTPYYRTSSGIAALAATSIQQNFSNKNLLDGSVYFAANGDQTKKVGFTIGGSVSTTLNLSTSQTTSQTLAIPNVGAGETLTTDLDTKYPLTITQDDGLNRTLLLSSSKYTNRSSTIRSILFGSGKGSTLTSATITLPAASGSDITGTLANTLLTMADDRYKKMVICLNSTNTLSVYLGSDQGTAAAAISTSVSTGSDLAIGFYIIQTVGSVVQPVTNANIYQFTNPAIDGSSAFLRADGSTNSTGVQNFTAGIKTDSISAYTGGSPVTINSVELKTGGVKMKDTSSAIRNISDDTKQVLFSVNNAAGVDYTLNFAQTGASRIINFPVLGATDTIAVLATAQTFTNKTIDGASNTLSNIGDSSLSTSYIKADGTRALTGNWGAGAFSGTFNSVVVGSAVNRISGLNTIITQAGTNTLTLPTAGAATLATLSLAEIFTNKSFSDQVKTPVIQAYDANGVIFKENGATTIGSVTDAGLWTLGSSGGTQTHVVNGNVNITGQIQNRQMARGYRTTSQTVNSSSDTAYLLDANITMDEGSISGGYYRPSRAGIVFMSVNLNLQTNSTPNNFARVYFEYSTDGSSWSVINQFIWQVATTYDYTPHTLTAVRSVAANSYIRIRIYSGTTTGSYQTTTNDRDTNFNFFYID